MITVALLLAVVAAVRYRTFRWVAAILLAVTFIQAHPLLVAGAVAVAVLLRAGWHGRRAVRAANEARRQREDELRARCVAEDRLWLAGDPRGFYGLQSDR
ncbi:hypothetical protein ACRU44_04525 [Mycobacterium colombiense]